MGFDAIYLFIQTSLVFFLSSLSYAQIPGHLLFMINMGLMLLFAVILFTFVLRATRQDIQLMILVGIVFGMLFRSFATLMQRLIDPSEFAVLQSVMFAQFGSIDESELFLATVMLLLLGIWLIKNCQILDVMALGRSKARSLGVNYDQMQFKILALISILVSVSTALVGPIVFLGLLVSALAHSFMRSHLHALLLPAAALISAIILVLGQASFEHILKLQSTLIVVIEFFGGLFFLALLSKGKIK